MRKVEGEGQEEEAGRGTCSVIPLLLFPTVHVPVALALLLGEDRRRGSRASGGGFLRVFLLFG